MPILVTSLYAALLAIVCIVLSAPVGLMRGKKQIALGDSGDPEMIVTIRRHANFIEYVPLALILMALVELNGGSKTWVHALGAVLVVARIVHPFGLDTKNLNKWQRIAGTAVTLLVIAAAAITLLWQYFR
jgi:uncharacterized protein